MDFLKSQIARLQEQIGALTATQKMLTAALLAIMIMTIIWWGRLAGTPEMEAVIDQDLSIEDMGRIKAAIAAKNVPYQVNGNRILVPADRKFELFVDLSYSQLLPANSESGWDEIISKMDGPFNSPSKNDAMWNKVKEASLAQVISNFPHVGRAMVILDNKQQRDFEHSFGPSASVNITLKSGAHMDKKLVDAAADVVAGACAGMERGRVKVIIDGVSFSVHDNDDGSLAGNWMDQVKESERYYSGKITDHLSFIDGVMVSVTVQPVIDQTTETKEAYDKDVIKVEKRIESESEEDATSNHANGGDVGTGPNTRDNLNGGGGAPAGDQNSQTKEKNRTEMELFPNRTNTQTRKPAGAIPVTAASVRVPRSYFVRIARQKFPELKGEPTDAVLQPILDDELPKIRNDVKNCTNLKNDDAISVADYIDAQPLASSVPQTASSPMSFAISGHIKEIVLGALAVMSLFMVSMMVKKAGPSPASVEAAGAAAAEAKAKVVNKILTVEELAGEVGEGKGSLEGVELDDEAIRGKQVVDQVSAMVKDNPDGAATLVKRWLSRT